MNLRHFEIIKVGNKTMGKVYAAGLAGLSWAVASAAWDDALKKEDFVACRIEGEISGERFEVSTIEIFHATATATFYRSESFREATAKATNDCIKLAVQKIKDIGFSE